MRTFVNGGETFRVDDSTNECWISENGEWILTTEYIGAHMPMFPMFYLPISEDRLERCVEKLTDRADSAFLRGDCTQAQYDRWNRRMRAWSDGVAIAK